MGIPYARHFQRLLGVDPLVAQQGRYNVLERLMSAMPVPIRLFSVNVTVTAATFITGVILARTLGLQDRGVFAAVTVWAATIASLALFGTHVFLARMAGRTGSDARTIYRTAYSLIAFLCWPGLLIYILIQLFFVKASIDISWHLIAIGALIVPGSMMGAMQVQVELGRRMFANFNFARQAFAYVFALAAFTLWTLDIHDVALFATAMMISTYVGVATTSRRMRKTLSGSGSRDVADEPRMLDTIRGSKSFALTGVFTMLAMQADKLLLSGLFPAQALGAFVVASSVAQLQNTVGEAFSQSIFAQMTAIERIEQIDADLLAQEIRQSVIVTACVCAALMLVLPPLLPLIYGGEFIAAAELLLILLPAVAIRVLTRPYEELVRGLGQPRLLFWILGAMVVVMLVGIAFAAYLSWVVVVAWAVMLGNLAGLTTALFLAQRVFGIPIHAALIPRASDFQHMLRRLGSIVTAYRQ